MNIEKGDIVEWEEAGCYLFVIKTPILDETRLCNYDSWKEHFYTEKNGVYIDSVKLVSSIFRGEI